MINEISEEIGNLDNISGASYGGGRSVESARFDIKVTRLTANIDKELPFALFGRQFLSSGFVDILPIPSGMTMQVQVGMHQAADNDVTKYCVLDLIFTEGANTDIVRIKSNAASSYPAILEATLSDVFKVSKLRMQLSDATKLDQFSTPLDVAHKSLFGAASQNPISIGSHLAPNQNQPHVLDIPINFAVDKETAVNGAMIAEAGLSVTFSVSVSRVRKHNRKALKY